MLIKLSKKLTIVNTLSKILILAVFTFLIPPMVSRVSIVNTDNLLWLQKEDILKIIDSSGINYFIKPDSLQKAYADYGLFKESYVSISKSDSSKAFEKIEFANVQIEQDIKSYRVLSYNFSQNETYYLLEIGKSIESIFETEYVMRRYSIYILAVVLILSVILDFGIHKRLLIPLEKIIHSLKKNVHPTDLNIDNVKSSTYDFKYLEKTLVSLMNRIKKSFTQEREFIGNVSHELLTPITIIQTKLDNLAINGDLNDEQLLKLMESQKTLKRLTRIVRTLLTISRIENQEYLLSEKTSIAQTIENIIEEVQDKAEIKNIAISMDINHEMYIQKANSDLLFTMFTNVINNSLKYTNSDGKIKIISENNRKVIIEDNGIGISEENIANIFNRHKKFSSDSNSFGLGLALTKKIADYHQIKINIFSQPEIGTKVEFTFP